MSATESKIAESRIVAQKRQLWESYVGPPVLTERDELETKTEASPLPGDEHSNRREFDSDLDCPSRRKQKRSKKQKSTLCVGVKR